MDPTTADRPLDRTGAQCPWCGFDAVREEHGHTRCDNCGFIPETCCEGGPA